MKRVKVTFFPFSAQEKKKTALRSQRPPLTTASQIKKKKEEIHFTEKYKMPKKKIDKGEKEDQKEQR